VENLALRECWLAVHLDSVCCSPLVFGRALPPIGDSSERSAASGAAATVNGVAGKGGSLGAPGPVVVDGMLFVGSGYIGTGNGMPGNVLLAFSTVK
jgi:hypothetical protein